jgi:Transglutaminase-like superfamily
VWLIDAPPGALQVDYHALLSEAAPAPACDPADELVYLRPSRYCQSDRLVGFASRHFHHLHEPHDVLAAVSSWVGTQLEYIPGSSGPTDGAVDTLLAARGVCRDYAHLAVALLRALEIPARLAAVYAPGLDPMDFQPEADASRISVLMASIAHPAEHHGRVPPPSRQFGDARGHLASRTFWPVGVLGLLPGVGLWDPRLGQGAILATMGRRLAVVVPVGQLTSKARRSRSKDRMSRAEESIWPRSMPWRASRG